MATPDQINVAVGETITGVLNDLISGKNPLTSKTLVTNGIFIAVGIVGTVYQTWVTGDPAAIAPFLTMVGAGAVNTVLRFLTTGPVITNGMQSIMDALLRTNITGK